MSARTEALERWPENYNMGRWDGVTINAERSFIVQRQAFEGGARWSTEETPERIEAVARALVGRVSWEHAHPASISRWKNQARDALAALRALNDEETPA